MTAQQLEEFVLSNDRRKLLQIDDEQAETKNEEKIDDAFANLASSIIYGTDDHKYYHLLQIENEITSILMNNNDLNKASQDDINKLKSLLNEASDIIIKYNENKKDNNYSTESDIDILSFRHKLRTLFLSPYIKIEENKESDDSNDEKDEEDIYDILINKLEVSFNHSKPNDTAITGNNTDEKEEKISSIMGEFNLQKQFDKLFSKCNNSSDITKYVILSIHKSIQMKS